MEEVAVFPLPNLLLLNKVPMPLHIFEARYRQMLSDCLEQNRRLTVTPLKTSQNYQNEMVIAGFPQVLEKLNDGKSNILLQGEEKFELLDCLQEEPYLIYRCLKIHENYDFDDSHVMMLDSIKDLLVKWARQEIRDKEGLKMFMRVLRNSEVRLNYAGMCLVKEIEVKKELLRYHTGVEKLEVLTRALCPKEIHLGPWLKSIKVR